MHLLKFTKQVESRPFLMCANVNAIDYACGDNVK